MTAAEITAALAGLTREELLAVVIAAAARMAQAKAAPTSEADDLLDIDAARAILGVSRSWLHHRPQLPFRRKIGGKLKFSRAGIERWKQRDHAA